VLGIAGYACHRQRSPVVWLAGTRRDGSWRQPGDRASDSERPSARSIYFCDPNSVQLEFRYPTRSEPADPLPATPHQPSGNGIGLSSRIEW